MALLGGKNKWTQRLITEYFAAPSLSSVGAASWVELPSEVAAQVLHEAAKHEGSEMGFGPDR
jgi:hypothetical protein